MEMASGVHEWQQIKEEITCSICGELFTDPKTIPCLHTFCKRCIERSIESNKKMATVVCCPLCRVPLSRDQVDLTSIPTNFTINRLVEIFGKRKQIEGQKFILMKCGKCVEDATAVTWCIDCDNPLCLSCNEFHSKWKDFQSHKTVTVATFLQNPKRTLVTPEKAEFCKIHTNQPLDLYCKTCSKLICQYCTLKDHPRGHRDHDYDFVDEMVDEEREKIKEVIATLKHLIERVRNGVKTLENCEKQVDMESEANIEKIRATYGEIYKLLKQQEEETVEKVNTIKNSFNKTLTIQKENAKLVENQLVNCNEFCEKMVTINRTRQLLTYNKWIKSRVDELLEQVEQASLDPECKANDMTVCCNKPLELVSSLSPICVVSPNVPLCIVSGPILIGNPVKVIVMLSDVLGHPVVNQSKDLEIRCNQEFLQNTHIEDESTGQYHIWYNPKRKEDHSLLVYWRGLVLNHEEIKISVNIRNYATIKKEIKIINKFGPTNKQLQHPYQVAKVPNGGLIFRDCSTQQLIVLNKQFQYSHAIASGNEEFQNITGIAVDEKECLLYVADGELNCIQKFKLNGKFISQLGSEGTTDGKFQNPHGLMLFQSDLFVCDFGNHRIQVLQNEQFSYTFGQHGTDPGSFNRPADLTMNSSKDQLFITDCGNHRIQVFTPKGDFLKIFGNFFGIPFRLKEPAGIHYTPDGHFLISSNLTHCVLVFEEGGKFIAAIEGTYQGKERFSHPCGVLMMDNGQIVIAGGANSHRLVVF